MVNCHAENNFWYINIDLFVNKCWLYVTRHESMYNEIAGANIIEIANKHNYPIYLSYEMKDMTALNNAFARRQWFWFTKRNSSAFERLDLDSV